MLRLERILPAAVHVAGLRVAHALRVRWWRISGRSVRGCRVLVLDADGHVLLIRHSYGTGHWMLPGGGLGRNEDPLVGAARELHEEVAIVLDHAVLLGRTDDPLSVHETHLIGGWCANVSPRPDGREIIAAAFFAPDALPDPMPSALAARLGGWITAAQAARRAG